jgi:hypothetical protein
MLHAALPAASKRMYDLTLDMLRSTSGNVALLYLAIPVGTAMSMHGGQLEGGQ